MDTRMLVSITVAGFAVSFFYFYYGALTMEKISNLYTRTLLSLAGKEFIYRLNSSRSAGEDFRMLFVINKLTQLENELSEMKRFLLWPLYVFRLRKLELTIETLLRIEQEGVG